MMGLSSRLIVLLLLLGCAMMIVIDSAPTHDYKDALMKSILFFEGQRSGKLPPNQRMSWRKDSGLRDGQDIGVDLVGGYYDAGDNVKFNFPMAFSTTMLAWSVIESGKYMGSDLQHALDAIRWATDYFLKATSVPGVVYAQVGDPYADHNCWERPEDMDTPRTVYAVTKQNPGSEVSAEIAAALAASSIVFRSRDRVYASKLRSRAKKVFNFADKYQGSYNDSLGHWVCPFYCDYSGYQDELLWGAAWLFKASKKLVYLEYLLKNIHTLGVNGGSFAEFGWDAKHAGINVLVSRLVMDNKELSSQLIPDADKFICSVLPESPSVSVSYSPAGLIFKTGGSNLQHATALSFLLLTYARYLRTSKGVVPCGNIVASPERLVEVAKSQVDYILGSNPLKMSYMVGYGKKFPRRIHHRGSSLSSLDQHPHHINCQSGATYFFKDDSNPNLLIGAIVGGPDINDIYIDSRADFEHSEPTTYINAPLVGVLAYFKTYPY